MIFLIQLAFSSPFVHPHQEKSFLNWMKNTNQLFVGNEYQIRFGIWLTNQRLVHEQNSGGFSFQISMNKFAALTPSEYQSLLGFKRTSKRKPSQKSKLVPTDAIVDWRTKGVVNPIQDQGQCGSCWAFSAVEAIETEYAIKYGHLYKFSEQNLLDCDFFCDGCDGCEMDNAFEFILEGQDGNLTLSDKYPYYPFPQKCKYDPSSTIHVLEGYVDLPKGDEVALAAAVQQYGVISIAIDASHYSFQLYFGGIYDEPSCDSTYLDHAVGLIGYGSERGVNYWIVRNSWGLDWGENGYIRMVKDKNNQCGEASDASYPIIA